MNTKEYKTPKHIERVIKLNKDKEAFYIYDLEVMKYKMNLLSILPDNVDTYYAMKVNPNFHIVKEALNHENIAWIEVASKWEIDIVLSASEDIFLDKISKWWKNIPNEEELYNYHSTNLWRVIYTWPSKKQSELEFSVNNNIKYLNIESWKEAIVVNLEAEKKWKTQSVLMRLNTKHKFEKWEAWVTLWSWDTQFGFPQDEAIDYLYDLEKLENISVDGFHMYPATWILNAEVLLRSVDETFNFIKSIEDKTWKKFKTIDFGWWFWIDYGWFNEFDLEKYSSGLKKLIDKYNMNDKTLILELWRYLWADMWYFVTKVNDIKTLWSWAKWVLCNAWTNAHKRPQILNVDYHLDVIDIIDENINSIKQIAKKIWRPIENIELLDNFNSYWPFCTSVDKIAWNKKWLKVWLWDFLVIPQAWAYWKTMSPQWFLSHPEIEEIIIDNDYIENKVKINKSLENI